MKIDLTKLPDWMGCQGCGRIIDPNMLEIEGEERIGEDGEIEVYERDICPHCHSDLITWVWTAEELYQDHWLVR